MLIGIDANPANRNHKSGTEWYAYYLIRWLAKLDSKNQYILYTSQPLKAGLSDLTAKQCHCEKHNGVIKFDKRGRQIIKSPFNNFRAEILRWPWPFFWTLGRLTLEMLFSKIDVLFIPAHAMPLVYPKKTINTIHDVAFERRARLYDGNYPGVSNDLARKMINFLVGIFTFGKYGADSTNYLRWSTRFALKHAKKIITVSEFSKREITKIYNIEEDKVKVIYNGYNNILYKKIFDENKMNEVLEKYGIEKPYLLYVGRLEKKKNIPMLVNAFAIAKEKKEFKKIKLVLVGDPSFGFDEVKYLIEEFNLSSEVIMPGWVEEDDLPYIYNSAEAFVFPSKYEGFGIPIIQAMACEIPVAASNIDVLSEIGQDAAIYFNPDDKRDIVKALTRITTEAELRAELIKNGKKRVKDFSWEKTAEETLAAINNL